MGNLISHPCVHPKNGQRYELLCPIQLSQIEIAYLIRMVKPPRLDRSRVIQFTVPQKSVELLREHLDLRR